MTPTTLYEMDGTPHEVVPVEGSSSWFRAKDAETYYHAFTGGRYDEVDAGRTRVVGHLYDTPHYACQDAGWPIEAIELVMSIADEVAPGTLVEVLMDRAARTELECGYDTWRSCLSDSAVGEKDICPECALVEEAKK